MSFDPNHIFVPVPELRWLFFDLNSYFASVEQQENPNLRGRPIAVVPGMTDSTCAIAASYEAKALGIKTGTKIYEAKKMCPDLVCVQARHDVYVDYHQRIFDEVGRHIPISKICSIDEGACQLFMGDRSIEHATQLAKEIKQGIAANIGDHIRCSIGVAPNIFLAKTASDMQKPDGLTILNPHTYRERICALKLRDLCGIGHNIEKRLNKSGVFTIEQLWHADPKHVRKIWGSVGGEKFWYRLRGYEVPETPTNKSVIGHSRVLDPSHRAIGEANDIARQLTSKACARLRRYNLYATHFSLSIRTVDRKYWGGRKNFKASQDSLFFLEHLKILWGNMQCAVGNKKLLKVSITISGLKESSMMTLDLFDSVPEIDKPQKLNQTLSNSLDDLNKRFGANTIRIGQCLKTSSGHVGTKIAFNRVPTKEEFLE